MVVEDPCWRTPSSRCTTCVTTRGVEQFLLLQLSDIVVRKDHIIWNALSPYLIAERGSP